MILFISADCLEIKSKDDVKKLQLNQCYEISGSDDPIEFSEQERELERLIEIRLKELDK